VTFPLDLLTYLNPEERLDLLCALRATPGPWTVADLEEGCALMTGPNREHVSRNDPNAVITRLCTLAETRIAFAELSALTVWSTNITKYGPYPDDDTARQIRAHLEAR